jgi:hypothetical protein
MWPSTTIGSPPWSGAGTTLSSVVRRLMITPSRALLGRWKSAAVRAFSVAMCEPMGKVGAIRSRYMRFPPSSTTAIDPPSFPRFASAAAAAATALAPSSVGIFLVLVACAPASPAAASAMASTSVPMAFMAPLPLCMMSAAW